MKNQFDGSDLKAWFIAQKRDLPWRQTRDPYAIWISEIMLQQTQVAVVIPYFLHWMQRFPTVHHLSQASLDEVLKTWEGLGYYSRARYLHEGAKYLVAHHQGQIPSHEAALKEIKGMGPYTVGAILSFAFHQKKAAVDGNVIRVLTRYFGIEEDISKPVTINKLRQIAQELLPDDEPWVINEALIELGATVCQRKSRCTACPLQMSCVSASKGQVDVIPFNSKKVKIERLYRSVVVIRCGDHLLVKKGEKGAVMSDLYEFPYFESSPEGIALQEAQNTIASHYALQVVPQRQLKEVSHGFTRYQAKLFPLLFTCSALKPVAGFEWLSYVALKQLAFSSGHRRILQQLDDWLPPI